MSNPRHQPNRRSFFSKGTPKPKKKKSFPDLNKDGKITKADILKGRGVDLRDGGEASGPGTGTSDSIPARLSDGEFVMTADAVREFGDGDVNKGAERMYAMMKKLENGGRV